jgi:hypothetical protein
MKKIATLTAAALVLSACGPASEDPAKKFRDALPKTEAVQVGSPSADTAAGALTVRSSTVLGDSPATQSAYAILSRNFAVMINGGTALTLGILRFVTAFPPTSCDHASCTWGPGVSDDGLNRMRLVVTQVDDHFDYALSGQRGSDATADWENIITGTAYPGDDADHGSGTLTFDADAEARLDHGPLWEQRDFGHATITYDNTGSPVTVGAEFVGGHNELDQVVNAAYSFEQSASGGDLQIAFQNETTTEIATIHTRWSPSGAGRSDVNYDADGAGATEPYPASECWDGEVNNFAEVYDSKFWEARGTESLCSPFSSAVYADIVLP